MQLKILKSSALIGALLLPSLVFAIGAIEARAGQLSPTGGLFGVLNTVRGIMDTIIPILITLALIYFLIGVGNYILKPSGLEGARDQMLYGLVGLFVMVSVWGLVRLLSDTFNINQREKLEHIPTISPGAR